jgi:pimeloyl-ACP methyl ester carboxylesterase
MTHRNDGAHQNNNHRIFLKDGLKNGLKVSSLALIISLSATTYATPNTTAAEAQRRCEQLPNLPTQQENPAFRITHATWQSGAEPDAQNRPPLPPHCAVQGLYGERTGADGQSYAVKFHVRLPMDWNQRLLFQGGGGLNGHVGDAIGHLGNSAPALAKGFAVVSHDSGHDAKSNNDPARGGEAAFGFDFEARKNYAHAAIPSTHKVATTLINQWYRQTPQQSYFYGCSKGGQEGMIAAQRYPELFDGIAAIAPGISLPKAALAQAWDTQVFASLMSKEDGALQLGNSFSPAQLHIVSEAFLAACDELDGLKDGIIHHFPACTTDKVYPALQARTCAAGSDEQHCLSSAQIEALKKSFAGAKNNQGEAIYAAFPFDTGITDFGWRMWKLGNPQMPPLNVILGMPALASVFSTPPQAVETSGDKLLRQQREFNFERDAAVIFATHKDFTESAWGLMGATSPNLDKFKARGGKLLVAHGVSDPVFSVNDTIAWWNQVDARYDGKAQEFARLFPVPGMGHCQGGPATDQFDAFSALLAWAEQGSAPDSILATAGPSTPWPGIERPLCAYPKLLSYRAADDKSGAGTFECQ